MTRSRKGVEPSNSIDYYDPELHSGSVNRQPSVKNEASRGPPNDDEDTFEKGRPTELEFEPGHPSPQPASCDAGFPARAKASIEGFKLWVTNGPVRLTSRIYGDMQKEMIKRRDELFGNRK
jgi:hypothetical protein